MTSVYPAGAEPGPPPVYQEPGMVQQPGIPVTLESAMMAGAMNPGGMNSQMMQVQMSGLMNQQQTGMEWAGISAEGLEALDSLDSVTVDQQLDMIQMMTQVDQPNKYKVLTPDDKLLFMLEEVNSYSSRRDRQFNVKGKDSTGKEVFSITREHRPCSYCFFCFACVDCCKSEAQIYVGQKKVAELKQIWSFRDAKFYLEDDEGMTLYLVEGTIACCTMKVDYKILPCDRSGSGSIKKYGEGLSLGNTKYKIEFPDRAEPLQKAMIICTNILLDYRFHYYVSPAQRQRRRR